MKTTAEIRDEFLQFFKDKGHAEVPSSSLIPGNDPSLLFTNAGMVQFKEVFLGLEKRPYSKAVSSQRCVRAGGKHNDLENVGYTARHHTFFEMLGNFSFGDYFKQEAIAYAWEFLTGTLGLPEDRLWVTVYEDDDEAADIWLTQIGVSESRFSRIGAKDNFWSMGDTGPCGPCTEIFYDHGEDVPGGPPGTPEEDGDRYIEIWNLVFMQYDRDSSGEMKPLPHPSVDTGMGLERLAAVLQHVHSNYEIDLFQSLIKAAAKAVGISDMNDKSLRVIADHIRSCSFLILDGVTPSNEGRGYVLRRIIRRAARHGHKLGQTEPFFYTLLNDLAAIMGDAYPELAQKQETIEKVLKQEEERFAITLDKGMGMLQSELADTSGGEISGALAFKLYDTYGFPVDLTADVAREAGLSVDMEGFEREMEAQRNRARGANSFTALGDEGAKLDVVTEFVGYDQLRSDSSMEVLLKEGEQVDALDGGDRAAVVLDTTPFYAESGGQVGDSGILTQGDAVFVVEDTQKAGAAYKHIGYVKSGYFQRGDRVEAIVDGERRSRIVLNHSATHLMHAALREVLGDHVQQKGSLVTPERLRFDFSHFEPVTPAQLAEVERIVNKEIRDNAEAQAAIMSIDDAMESGAMALFGEKYGDEVRVMKIGFSTELCGGVHVKRAGDIGLFKIVSESGVASGVRRIEAVTGELALEQVKGEEAILQKVSGLLKTSPDQVDARLQQLLEKEKQLEKELQALKSRLASQLGSDIADQAKKAKGIHILAAIIPDADVKSLRDTLDQLKNKLGKAAIVLGTSQAGKVTLIAGVTKDESKLIKAGDLVNFVAQQVGGRGGGRPDMAQAGGSQPENLQPALDSVYTWVEEALA
ncbi:MAG: alanine--tRNA ligase [bacterium]